MVPQEDEHDSQLTLRRHSPSSTPLLRAFLGAGAAGGEFLSLARSTKPRIESAPSREVDASLPIARALVQRPRRIIFLTSRQPVWTPAHRARKHLYQLKERGIVPAARHRLHGRGRTVGRPAGAVSARRQIVAEGSPSSISSPTHRGRCWKSDLLRGVTPRGPGTSRRKADRSPRLPTTAKGTMAKLVNAGHRHFDLLPKRAGLEDVFLALTGRTLAGGQG